MQPGYIIQSLVRVICGDAMLTHELLRGSFKDTAVFKNLSGAAVRSAHRFIQHPDRVICDLIDRMYGTARSVDYHIKTV